MSSSDFDQQRENFENFYHESASLWTGAVDSLKTLMQFLLTDRPGVFFQSVTGRVKKLDDCISKFCRKYQRNLERTEQPYEIKDHITDIIGLRVVGLYETDIQLIRKIIEAEFCVDGETDKSANIEAQDDTFGYKGLHLDLKLKEPRSVLLEYERFKDLRFELQLRTIVQDAWSVIDHKIKYKKNVPDTLRRRINRLAALFELADQEFLSIRDETTRYEESDSRQKHFEQQLVAQDVIIQPSLESTRQLDAFGFVSAAMKHFVTYRFDGSRIDDFVDELRRVGINLKVDEFNKLLDDRLAPVKRFQEFVWKTQGSRMNPYTLIRHCIYLSNNEHGRYLLFKRQRLTFDKWMSDGQPTGDEMVSIANSSVDINGG